MAGGNVSYWINTVFANFSTSTSGRGLYSGGSGNKTYVYDCVFSTGYRAIDISGANSTLYVENSIFQGWGQNVYNSYGTWQYCVSNDATLPTANNNTNSSYVAFNGTNWLDFRLKSTDTVAKDTGVSLASDVYFPFNYDFLGTTRSQGSAWDRGVYEYPVTATSNRERGIPRGGWWQ